MLADLLCKVETTRAMSIPQIQIIERLTAILRRDLKLGPDTPLEPNTVLFGGDLDLDSLDALLLLQSVEREFGLKIPNEAMQPGVFRTLTIMAEFVAAHVAKAGT